MCVISIFDTFMCMCDITSSPYTESCLYNLGISRSTKFTLTLLYLMQIAVCSCAEGIDVNECDLVVYPYCLGK